MSLAPTQSAVANGLRGFAQMQNQQKLGLMVAIAAIIALVVGAWMWSQSPDYRVLYTNVSDRDGGEIIGALRDSVSCVWSWDDVAAGRKCNAR